MTDDTTDETADTSADDPDVDVDLTDEGEDAEMETVTLEVPISTAHDTMALELERGGVDVEEVLSASLQAQTEEQIHRLYQQGRHQQPR